MSPGTAVRRSLEIACFAGIFDHRSSRNYRDSSICSVDIRRAQPYPHRQFRK